MNQLGNLSDAPAAVLELQTEEVDIGAGQYFAVLLADRAGNHAEGKQLELQTMELLPPLLGLRALHDQIGRGVPDCGRSRPRADHIRGAGRTSAAA